MNFIITKATPVDKEAIVNLSLHFQNDYLDRVVDRWIKEESGGLYLAWHEGDLVACCALSFLSATEGWLHGMRVHPDYRRQGIAYKLNSYLLEVARNEGLKVIRLLTAPDNYQALGVAEGLGFSVTGAKRQIIYRATLNRTACAAPENSITLKLCSESDLSDLKRFISSGPASEALNSLIFCPGFICRTLTDQYLLEAIRREEVYLFSGQGSGWGMMVVVKDKLEDHLVLGYLDAPVEDLPSLFLMINQWAEEGYQYYSFNLLQKQHEVLQSYLENTFGKYETEQFLVMGKSLN